jgi:hypothetical protein
MRFQGVIGAALLGSSALQHVAASMQPDVEGDIINIDGDLVDAGRLEARQSGGKIPVTGVTGNGVQPRMELRVMQQQYPDMFNVFLLGLRSFMQMSQSDPLSYYQIAGTFILNKLPNLNIRLIRFQASTEDLTFPGTMLALLLDLAVVTALTLPICSCLGTDLIWLSLRFVIVTQTYESPADHVVSTARALQARSTGCAIFPRWCDQRQVRRRSSKLALSILGLGCNTLQRMLDIPYSIEQPMGRCHHSHWCADYRQPSFPL